MDTLTVVHLETFEVSPMLQEVVSTITRLVAKKGGVDLVDLERHLA